MSEQIPQAFQQDDDEISIEELDGVAGGNETETGVGTEPIKPVNNCPNNSGCNNC